MKRMKKPTRDQKALIERNGMNPKEWMVRMDAPNSLVVVNKDTGESMVLEK